MHFDRAATENAIAAFISPAFAGRAARVLVEQGHESLCEAEIGEVIAIAMASGMDLEDAAYEVSALSLSHIELTTAAGSIVLDVEDALNHPVIGPWVPATFCDAVAAPLRSGTQMLRAFAPGLTVPSYVGVELMASNGRIVGAALSAAFDGAANVVFQFVDPIAVNVAQTVTISGDSLWAMGNGLRTGDIPVSARLDNVVDLDAHRPTWTDATQAGTVH